MGPTLTEGRTDERSNPSRERGGRGVRQRLRGAVSRLVGHLLDAVAEVFVPAGQHACERTRCDGGTKRAQSREMVAIRPSGQARLESGPTGPCPDRSTDHEDEPEVAARATGEKLRVYETENDDAYITSDVYKRLKR